MATPTKFTVTRTKRKGRAVSADTVKANATLSKLWGQKARQEVEVIGPDGTVIETYAALVVDAASLGKPAAYTGMVGLVSKWAKDNGHAIRTSKVSDTHYAIRAKG